MDDTTHSLAKTVAGDITLADEHGTALRKWREIFGISQTNVAKTLNLTPSVISDYESGRRKNPGTEFVRKYVEALIKEDEQGGGGVVEKISAHPHPKAILDLQDFLTPIPAKDFLKTI